MLGEKNAADMNVIIKRIYSLFKDKCRWTAFFVTSSTCNDTIRSAIFCLLTRINCVSLHFGPHEKKNNQKIAWAVTAWNRKRTAIYVTKLIDVLQRWNQTRTSWEFKSYTQHNVCFFLFHWNCIVAVGEAHLFWCCKIAIIAHVKMHWGEKFNFNRILLSKHTCGDK